MRLTYLTSALLALLALLTVSCSRSGIHDRLDNVESFSRTEPDSALTLLSQMHDEVLHSDRSVQARYALLYTEAEYMSGVCQTNDSLIDISVRYYNMHESDIHRMKAYYYLGQVLIYAQDYSNAVVALLNAEHTAKILKNHLWLGLIYRSIADSFDALMDSGSATDYYKLSNEEFKKAPENIYTDFSLYDLSRSYSNAFYYETGLSTAKEVYRKAMLDHDTVLIAHSLRAMSKAYAGLKQYKNAGRAFKKLGTFGPRYVFGPDWVDIGLSYLREDSLQKAIIISDSVKKYMPEDNYLMFEIYRQQRRFSEAIPLLEKEMKIQNDAVKMFVLRNFSHVLRNYYNAQLNQFKEKISRERILKAFAFIGGFLLLSTVSLIFFRRTRAYRRKINQNIQSVSDMKNLLSKTTDVLDQAQKEQGETQLKLNRILDDLKEAKIRESKTHEKIQSLITMQFNTVDWLCNTYYQLRGNKDEEKKVYDKVISFIRSIGSDKTTITKLEDIANSCFENIIDRFQTSYPDMKDYEKNTFLFTVLGFSNPSICVLQNVSINTVYNRKNKLKQKIMGSANIGSSAFLKFFK